MSTDMTLDAFLGVEDDETGDDASEVVVPVFVHTGRDTDGTTGLSDTCDHCGGQVSSDFHRVFSDNDGALHGCPDCMTGTGIRAGGPALGRDKLRADGIDPECTRGTSRLGGGQ